MSNPPAGWYPDPGNSMLQRWWDSVQWGPQTRPAFQPPPPPQPSRVEPYTTQTFRPTEQQLTGGTTTRLRKTNGIGFAGAVVGLGSFIINPLLLTSVTGIILCIIGLIKDERMRNSGAQAAGRGWIIAGLVLSSVTAILYGMVYLRTVLSSFGH